MSRSPSHLLFLLPLFCFAQASAAEPCAKMKDCTIPPTDGLLGGFKDLLNNPYSIPFDTMKQLGYETSNRAWDSTKTFPVPAPGVNEETYYRSDDACYTTWFFDPITHKRNSRNDHVAPWAILKNCLRPAG